MNRLLACSFVASWIFVSVGSAGDEWSVRHYLCPPNFLEQGVEVGGKGLLMLPESPMPNSTEAEMKHLVKQCSEVFRAYLPHLPVGSQVVFDRDQSTLAASTSQEGHLLIESVVKASALDSFATSMAMQVSVMEVPFEELHKVLEEVAGKSDHTSTFEALKRAGHKVMVVARAEGKSGQRAVVEMGKSRRQATGFSRNAVGEIEATEWSDELLGLRVELDAVMEQYWQTIDLIFAIHHAEAPAALRRIALGEVNGAGRAAELMDVDQTNWTSATSLRFGESRLIGCWKMPDALTGRLCFLTSHASLVQPQPTDRAALWLRKHGEQSKPVSKKERLQEPNPSETAKMHRRKFRVPPDFLSFVPSLVRESEPELPSDPFGPNPSLLSNRPHIGAKAVLEAQGIEFPPGSMVSYSVSPFSPSELTVVNTLENLDRIEMFSGCCVHRPKVLQFRLCIVEANSDVVRKVVSDSLAVADHREMMGALQAEVAGGQGRVVMQAMTETKSGQRCVVESGTRYAWLKTNHKEPEQETNLEVEKSRPTPHPFVTIEHQNLGLEWEVDPVLGIDGFTIDLDTSIKTQGRAPTERPEILVPGQTERVIVSPAVDFHPLHFSSALTMGDGMWRMVSAWQSIRDDGSLHPDLMQAIFIQAVVMKEGEDTHEAETR